MRRLLLGVLLTGLALAGSACGLPQDESPREIAAEDLPEDLFGPSTTVADPGPGRVAADLYFMRADGQRLRRVVRELPDSSASTVLTALLAGPLPEEGDVRTAIPAGTTLLGTRREGEVMIITLTPEITTDVQNPQQQNAFAQIVYTADRLREVTAVRFVVNDQVVAVPTPLGNTDQPVTPFNFNQLRPES